MNKPRLTLTCTTQPRGAVVILVAIGLILLFGVMGIAIDTGYAYLLKARLQNTADAAALACVIDPDACRRGEQHPDINPHGFSLTVMYPYACPNPVQETGCARAVASYQWRTLFMGLLGSASASADAMAIAGRRAALPSCITTVSGMSINGTNMLTLNNCTADIGGRLDTTNKSGIKVAEGTSGSITVYNGNDPSNCGNCSPEPVGTTNPIPELPSFLIPTNDLDGSPLVTRVGSTCRSGNCLPGIYTSAVRLTGDTTFASGVYVFQAGLDTNGQRLRNAPGGVSLYLPGTTDLLLTGDVTLTAPTPSGCAPGSGVVISHPLSGVARSLSLNGSNVRLNLTGVVNLSADNISVGGSSANIVLNGTLVANSLSLNGNMFPNISPNPCNNLYQTSRVKLVQ
jgi:hypothetical protein